MKSYFKLPSRKQFYSFLKSYTLQFIITFILFFSVCEAQKDTLFRPACTPECSGTWTERVRWIQYASSCTFYMHYYQDVTCDPCKVYVSNLGWYGCVPSSGSFTQLMDYAILQILTNLSINSCTLECPEVKTGVSVSMATCWEKGNYQAQGFGIAPCEPIISCCTKTYSLVYAGPLCKEIFYVGGAAFRTGPPCHEFCDEDLCQPPPPLKWNIDIENDNKDIDTKYDYNIYYADVNNGFNATVIKFNRTVPPETEFKILDLNGRVIYQTYFSNAQDLMFNSALPSGIYFYVLNNKDVILGKGKFYVK